MFKLKYLTAATLLAIAGQAGAATVGITDGSPIDEAAEGNGEFILIAFDDVRKVSYTRQFEMFVWDFVPSEKVGIESATGDATPEAGLVRVFNGDALFTQTFATSDPTNIDWFVSALDGRLTAGTTQSTPDELRILTTSQSLPLSNVATVQAVTQSAIQWDDVVFANNTGIGCNAGEFASCSTNDPTSFAYGAYLDTTQWQGLGATVHGLDTPAFFQYVTGKAGTAGLTKAARTLYDNSAGPAVWTLSADGTATYTLAPAGVVPVPAAVWLFGSGLLGLVGVARRKAKA
jgi:hypothetical protein